MESKFKFLTKFSFLKKVKTKSFLIVNIILFIALILLTNIDSIISYFGGDFNDDVKINIIDNTGYYDNIEKSLKGVEEYLSESKVIIKKESKSLEEAKKDLKDNKKILLVLNEDEENIFKVDFISDSFVDTLTYQSIVMTLNNVKSSIALEKSNIDPNELESISKSVEINRVLLDETKTADEESSRTLLSTFSLIIVLPCFFLIIYLVQMIGAEINEEKSTRSMEIIIGNVSPKTHFFSKVLASNLFIILQVALLIVYGSIGLLIRKFTSKTNIISSLTEGMNTESITSVINKSGILDKLGYVIPLILILIILSFLAYSLLAGILASMTTNMENFQQLQTPIMLISLVGYYLIMLSTAFPGAVFMKIIGVIPLLSISLAPSMILSGEIGVTLLLLAILLLILLNYILIKYGLRIYKVGILNYKETDLWKKMFKALKSK